MRTVSFAKTACGALALIGLLAGAACQQATVETNSNATTTNTNSTTVTTNVNATTATSTTAFEAREPERYRATVNFTIEATGKQPVQSPPVQVARSADHRRYSVTLPTLGEVIFLDRADKRYVILTGRKQYVELGPQTT